MRIGEVSALLGLDKGTIYNWMDIPEVAEHLSPSAAGKDGAAQRTFTQEDAAVLNTIRAMKAQNRRRPWSEIIERLAAGDLINEFPTTAVSMDSRTVPMPLVEQSMKLVAVRQERDSLIVENQKLSNKIVELSAKIDDLTVEILNRERELSERFSNREVEIRQGFNEQLSHFRQRESELQARILEYESILRQLNRDQTSELIKYSETKAEEVRELYKLIGRLEATIEMMRAQQPRPDEE